MPTLLPDVRSGRLGAFAGLMPAVGCALLAGCEWVVPLRGLPGDDDDSSPIDPFFVACAEVFAQSGWCTTTWRASDGGRLIGAGLDDGSLCVLGDGPELPAPVALSRLAEDVLYCLDGRPVRLPLGGEPERGDVTGCVAIAPGRGVGDPWYASFPDRGLRRYVNWPSLRVDEPDRVYEPVLGALAVAGDRLWAREPGGLSVRRFTLPELDELPPLDLSDRGADDLSAALNLYLLRGSRLERWLDGSLLDAVELLDLPGAPLAGLACEIGD